MFAFCICLAMALLCLYGAGYSFYKIRRNSIERKSDENVKKKKELFFFAFTALFLGVLFVIAGFWILLKVKWLLYLLYALIALAVVFSTVMAVFGSN